MKFKRAAALSSLLVSMFTASVANANPQADANGLVIRIQLDIEDPTFLASDDAMRAVAAEILGSYNLADRAGEVVEGNPDHRLAVELTEMVDELAATPTPDPEEEEWVETNIDRATMRPTITNTLSWRTLVIDGWSSVNMEDKTKFGITQTLSPGETATFPPLTEGPRGFFGAELETINTTGIFRREIDLADVVTWESRPELVFFTGFATSQAGEIIHFVPRDPDVATRTVELPNVDDSQGEMTVVATSSNMVIRMENQDGELEVVPDGTRFFADGENELQELFNSLSFQIIDPTQLSHYHFSINGSVIEGEFQPLTANVSPGTSAKTKSYSPFLMTPRFGFG